LINESLPRLSVPLKSVVYSLLYPSTVLAQVLTLPFSFNTIASAGDSTIYYSRNPIWLFLSQTDIESTAAHELAHVAHGKILGKSLLEKSYVKIPRGIAEGFAEHVSRKVICAIYSIDDSSLQFRAYEGYVREFRAELKKRGYKDEKDLVNAIKELSIL
jgi:hypothetical protein